MPLSTRSARGAIQTPRRAERGALTAGARAAGQCSEVVWEPLCDDGLLDVDPPPSLLLPLPMSLLYTPSVDNSSTPQVDGELSAVGPATEPRLPRVHRGKALPLAYERVHIRVQRGAQRLLVP
jgi:hypothetical protein